LLLDFFEHAQEDGGVGIVKGKATKHAAQLFFGDFFAVFRDIAALQKALQQGFGYAFDGSHRSGGVFDTFGNAAGAASQFVEANGGGLTEIHGLMLDAGGNVQKPMTMTEVVVGQTFFFGAEKDGDAILAEALANQWTGEVESTQGMLDVAIADGGRADNQAAIGDGFLNGGAFLGLTQERRSTYGGAGFAKGFFVGVDDAKMRGTEVAHGASHGTDV
jgi:hypothetical protein